MNSQELFNGMINALIELDKDEVLDLVTKALAGNVRPMDILNGGITVGLQQIGELFSEGEVFLPELLLAAEIAMDVMKDLSDRFGVGDQIEKRGKCIFATVEGDVHDIGKSLVCMIFNASGYEVLDAGVDVPSQKIIDLIKEEKPDVVGLSSLLSTTMQAQREFIEAVKEAGLRDSIKIMVGGAPVSREWAEKIGADGYAEDASSAVIEVDKLLGLRV
jgi:corrinoid protein of di/trimethylamine methyltransferase